MMERKPLRPDDARVEPYALKYSYKRSAGPVIGQFLAALGEGRILATRANDGRVIAPAAEYDPETGDALTQLVDVGPGGVVESWAYVQAPRPGQPLSHPFAWALVRLDGASTAMLHAVDAPIENMRTGMRVRAQFSPEPRGTILDLACFAPEAP